MTEIMVTIFIVIALSLICGLFSIAVGYIVEEVCKLYRRIRYGDNDQGE